MYNNYSTTNNNYHMNSPQLQTHFVQYEHPLLACIYGYLYEVHAMTIAHTARYDDKTNKTIIRTFRIPMVGPELMNFGPYDCDVTDEDFFFFPRGAVKSETFRKFISNVKRHSSIEEGLQQLFRHNLSPAYNYNVLPVTVYRDDDTIGIYCDWFRQTVNSETSKPINPVDLISLCALADAFWSNFQFIPKDESDKSDVSAATELQRLIDIFRKDNLYCYNSVGYDGEYCYSDELGRIAMSREEFFNKFPDAEPVYDKIFDKLYEKAFSNSPK